jgi:hypothetical protein
LGIFPEDVFEFFIIYAISILGCSNPGSKFHSFGQQKLFFEQRNYLFGQQILLAKTADFTGIGSNFC